MATHNNPCLDGNPFMLLGDGTSAPVLNYNLPQNTCYNGNGYFPFSIPEAYLAPAFLQAPASSPWGIAANMTMDQIVATLKNDVMGTGTATLLQNTHLFKRQKGLIKFLTNDGVRYLVQDNKPETYVVGDSTLRVAKVGGGMMDANQAEGASATSGGEFQTRINHLTSIPASPAEKIQVAGYTLEFMAQQVANGLIPELYVAFGGKVRLRFLPAPTAKPQLVVVEHYKMCSYLGDYGAGKTLKTFSLLPGEKTSISVKSFRDKTSSYVKSSSTNTNEYQSTYYADDETSTAVQSENILDSFSQYSADQLQSQIESLESQSSGSQNASSISSTMGSGGGSQGGFNLIGLINFQSGSSNSSSVGIGASSNSIREDHMSNLESSLESSVNESGQYRDVEVNTTTGNVQNNSSGGSAGGSSNISVSQQESTMIRAGEETVTIRQLQNINYSRVLNFVFRQMLQEYIVLTYLHDVSIVFTTGFPGHRRTVKLSQLDTLLEELIPDAAHREEVRTTLLMQFCNVTNYQGTVVQFAERVEESWADCTGAAGTPPTFTYWRKKAGITDSYSSGGLQLNVPGVILSVKSHILRTDSVVVDAILGQGEALDCYNSRLQDQAARSAELRNDRYSSETTQENNKIEAALQAIAAIPDGEAQAEAYKKMFGECCSEDLMLLLNANSGTPQ